MKEVGSLRSQLEEAWPDLVATLKSSFQRYEGLRTSATVTTVPADTIVAPKSEVDWPDTD